MSISRGLTRWVETCAANAWSVVALFVVTATVCLVFTANQLGINTDTADMISRDLPWRKDFIQFREDFPNRHRTILVVVDGTSAAAVEQSADRLAKALRQRPDLATEVFHPRGDAFFKENGLLYQSTEQLEDLADDLAQAQPLLGQLSKDFSAAGLLNTLARARSETVNIDDLDQVYQALEAALRARAIGESAPVPWRDMLGIGTDQLRQVLVVQPVLDYTLARPAKHTMEWLRGWAREEQVDVSIRLTGTVAMEHEELDSVVRGAGLAGILALVLVTAVLLVGLRSFAHLFCALVTLLVGLSGTAAFAAAAVGHLNLISVAFAVLYIGLGIDFIIHMILRFDELRSTGLAAADSLPIAAKGVGMSLVICAVTTSAGFFSFIPTPFEGVSELGLISGTGMFISLFVSLTLLPALLSLTARDARSTRSAWLGAAWLQPLVDRPRAVVTVGVLITVGALMILPRASFDNDPIHLREPSQESVATFKELMRDEQTAPMGLFATASSDDEAEAWADTLSALPEVRSVVSLGRLVPDDQEEKRFILEDIQLLLGPDFADTGGASPDASRLEAALGALPAETTGGEAEQGFYDAARLFVSSLDQLSGDQRRDTLLALENDLIGALPGELRQLDLSLKAQPVERGDLPGALVERFKLADGRALIEISPSQSISDSEFADRFIGAVWAVAPNATGLPVVHQEGGRTVVKAFMMAFAYALIIIAILLWVFMSRFTESILVLVPILMAAAVTAGIMVAIGQPFNFANVIALPLLLGVGVDNGIHIVHRLRTEPPEDRGQIMATSTSRAVWFSGLTTVASFGNLAFSPHPGMASMGLLLTIGMLTTMAATLVFLPALIRWINP